MKDLAARLRALRHGPPPTRENPDSAVASGRLDLTGETAAAVEACLGARRMETSAGPCAVIEHRHEAAHHGRCRLHEEAFADRKSLAILIGRSGGAPGRPAAGESPRLLFFDIETTGLTGGAGNYAFLVGCGFFEDGVFHIRQFFLPSPASERALLAGVADCLADFDHLVTFNGKAFDVPVIEMRWSFHRMQTSTAEKRHLDMLHAARRFWRLRADEIGGSRALGPNANAGPWTRDDGDAGDEERGATPSGADWPFGALATRRADPVTAEHAASCSLSALEQRLLGVRRSGDVNGFEIPSRYFEYLRSGNPRRLVDVLQHNRLDLLSLAAMTAVALRLVREGPDATTDPQECLALGRMYERAGTGERVLDCYRRAVEMAGTSRSSGEAGWGSLARATSTVGREALHRLALRLRRERRHDEAAATWERLLAFDDIDARLRQEAIEALAIHHEHRSRDLPRARQFAIDGLSAGPHAQQQRLLHYRLERLERKLAGRPARAHPGSLLPPPGVPPV